MGRLLYSQSYSMPTVRNEPEPAPPAISYEKWTRWNAFDPDSDEFFQSDEAVYEAFIDPADVHPVGEDEGRQATVEPPEPERLEAMIVRELEDRSDSPSSSEGTISGRGSPMAVGTDDPARMLADLYRVNVAEANELAAAYTNSDVPALTPYHPIRRDSEQGPGTIPNELIQVTVEQTHDQLNQDPHQNDYVIAGFPVAPRPVPVYHDLPPVIPTSASPVRSDNRRIEYGPRASRTRIAITPDSPASAGFIPPSPTSPRFAPNLQLPVTPPQSSQALDPYLSPSPAPTVTPRLYSWSTRTHFGRNPASPSPYQRRTGPLTNPGARMSLAHLSPAPIRVRMA